MSWLDRFRNKNDSQEDAPRSNLRRALAQTTIQKQKGWETVLRIAKPPHAASAARLAPIDTLLDFSPGARISNIYTIRRQLGAGAMGTVYLAHHEQWNIEIVLKVPNPEVLADPQNRHRIVREAEVWTELGLHLISLIATTYILLTTRS